MGPERTRYVEAVIEWAIESEASGSRSQDRVALLELGQIHVALVADGAGNSAGGREAADAVVAHVEALRPRRKDSLEASYWAEVLEQIDADLERDPGAGETSATLVAVVGTSLVGASCGGSGAHLFRRDAFLDLSSGQRRDPLLGSGSATATGFGPEAFEGTLVLASDGLLGHAPFRAIWDAALLPDLRMASTAMASLPRLPSGAWPDDVSILLARLR
jgi:hypothetical protein